MTRLKKWILKRLFKIDLGHMEFKMDKLRRQRDILDKHFVELDQNNQALKQQLAASEISIKAYQIALDPQKLQDFQLQFDITHEKEPIERWGVITGYCQLGGCDMESISFDTPWGAQQKAVEMSLQGLRPVSDTTCATCYQEYSRECM